MELKLIFSEDDYDIDKFKLIGGHFPKEVDDYTEVSLNSAIGLVLYKAKLGSKIFYETDAGKKIEVEVLKKIENKKWLI